MESKVSEPRPHPLIEQLLKSEPGERIAVLEGYLGPTDNGRIRIFRHLDVSSYLEMDVCAILHIQQIEDSHIGRTRAFVRASTKVTQVSTRTFTCGDASMETAARVRALAERIRSTVRGVSGLAEIAAATLASMEQIQHNLAIDPSLPLPTAAYCEELRNTIRNIKRLMDKCLEAMKGASPEDALALASIYSELSEAKAELSTICSENCVWGCH